ncbi:dihydrolipoyl dehydrogenase family protein [Nakamurella endophytica]|uniref:Oxidoreductase n=1 Tax=Nakamurella endophytica TaxID=1748367 RepID=A0A917WB34_9ACTN|nr:NAD(P)/FAD-dependent oxidoreductase [Nakamurella endophytica]GGL89125.1 oxidoreductase [Nakamurella endophytica]
MTGEAGVVDLLVVGGGTAGLVAARTAARLGASVLLVERVRTGGECLWTGCVPSKALLAAAHAAADARAAARLGVRVGDGTHGAVAVDFPAVLAGVRRAIAAVQPDDSVESLEAGGVEVLSGTARFTGPAAAEVDTGAAGVRVVRFRSAVLATGSDPVVPDVPGLAGAAPLTNEDVWTVDDLPRRLLVVGGGAIGCELGQAFARLGSAVTLVESGSRLLVREDPEAAALLARALAADGIDLRTGVALRSVHPAADGAHRAELSDGTTVGFERVVVAAGRRPRTAGLELAAAGVDVDEHGQVVTDTALRTSNPWIFAAGDVTAHPRFTHVAGVHGSTAAGNAVLGLRRRADPAVPRVTFTQPEVAAVGVAAQDGRHVLTVRHEEVDRARAEDAGPGFTRLVLDRRNRIVGATVVGPRAGEMLSELALAVRLRCTAADLAGTMHAYPTYADGSWKAAIARVQDQLDGRLARLAVQVLRRWHRSATTRGRVPVSRRR